MRIKESLLDERIVDLLVRNGMTEYDAICTSKCLLTADLYGIKTHGTVVLPSHIKRIQSGGYNLAPSYKVIRETESFAVIDADNAIGFASATYCMEYAIEKCRKNGMFAVFSRNANAYGAAMNYPMQAAKEGMIGFTCCNSPAAMAPVGGKERKLGTNPLSMVIPTGSEPIIIDMATSKVAKSRFLQAKREGKPLGDGWALNKDGVPTNDPDEGIQGLVCPMEGFKGYGLALMIDVISGLLSGAAWQDHVKKFYNEDGAPMNVGHFFLVIEPEIVLGSGYWDMISHYVAGIRKSDRADENIAVAMPGDDKHRNYKDNSLNGLEVSDEVENLMK